MALHSGIDIEATHGQSVVATADGVVEHAGLYRGYGGYRLWEYRGNIESQRLEIKKDGCVIGDVFTKSLIVESGGTYIMEGVSWNSHLKIRYRNYPLKPR